MRVALWDLETSNLNADFGIILCGVVKEIGHQAKIFRIDETKTYKKEPWNDVEVVNAIYSELRQYDIMVGWNSSMFDLPFLNSRLLYHKLEAIPRRSIKHIDLLYRARVDLQLHDNKLGTVAEYLGVKIGKTAVDGVMWVKALTGDKNAMDYIVNHCVRDVIILEEVYDKLKRNIKEIR